MAAPGAALGAAARALGAIATRAYESEEAMRTAAHDEYARFRDAELSAELLDHLHDGGYEASSWPREPDVHTPWLPEDDTGGEEEEEDGAGEVVAGSGGGIDMKLRLPWRLPFQQGMYPRQNPAHRPKPTRQLTLAPNPASNAARKP